MVRLPRLPQPPPRPKLEGNRECPNCLETIVRTKALVCAHCGYTLRIPWRGWIGAVMLLLSIPAFTLWIFDFRVVLQTMPLLGGVFVWIGFDLPANFFQLTGLVLLFLGAILAFSAGGAIRAESVETEDRVASENA